MIARFDGWTYENGNGKGVRSIGLESPEDRSLVWYERIEAIVELVFWSKI